jgi:hypothetical protein
LRRLEEYNRRFRNPLWNTFLPLAYDYGDGNSSLDRAVSAFEGRDSIVGDQEKTAGEMYLRKLQKFSGALPSRRMQSIVPIYIERLL